MGIVGRSKKTKGKMSLFIPITIWLILFLIIPAIFIFTISFFSRDNNSSLQVDFTLNNYIQLLSPLYFKILIRSIGIALFTTIFCFLFGYPFAYLLTSIKKKWQGLFLLLVMLPFWTNSLVRTYAWIILLGENGIINKFLLTLHIIDAPIHMLYTTGAVYIGMTYIMFPFMVLPLYSSIEKLDDRILEAAEDLGANKVQRFFKVTLPLTKGGIMSGCILVFVPTLGLFFIPDLLGGSKYTLVSNLIKEQFGTASNWPLGAAISIVIILLMIGILSLYKKLGGKTEEVEVF